jgi:hypothetical protein
VVPVWRDEVDDAVRVDGVDFVLGSLGLPKRLRNGDDLVGEVGEG